jgi:hypothetical protein
LIFFGYFLLSRKESDKNILKGICYLREKKVYYVKGFGAAAVLE